MSNSVSDIKANPLENVQITNNSGSSAVQAGRVDNPKTETVYGTTPVKSLGDLTRLFKVTSTISENGRKYIDRVKEVIMQQDKNVKTEVLTIPAETIVFYKAHHCIVLLFSEALSREDDKPLIGHAKAAKTTVETIFGNNMFINNVILVTPEDYTRPENMATYILNSFVAILEPSISNITWETFKDYQIQVSSSPDMYDSFVSKYSPHGVPARADLKLCIYATKSGNINPRNNVLWIEDKDKIDIAAVGAYIRFSCQSNAVMPKYIPEIHISEILCGIPSANIIPLILGIAKAVLMDQNVWKSQFLDFGGANNPNIGNLISDQNGSPFRVENHTQLDQLIATYCEHPILILDISEGRARVIGLEQYSFALENANNTANNFFGLNQDGLPILGKTVVPFQLSGEEFSGYIRNGATYVDSRWADYLNLMIHNYTTPMRCRALLNHFVNPIDQIKALRELGQEVVTLYTNYITLIRPEYINPIQAEIMKKMRINISNQATGYMDLSGFYNAAQGFVQNPYVAAGSGTYNNQFYNAGFYTGNWR